MRLQELAGADGIPTTIIVPLVFNNLNTHYNHDLLKQYLNNQTHWLVISLLQDQKLKQNNVHLIFSICLFRWECGNIVTSARSCKLDSHVT
jgi:hypothetical protein